MVKNIGLYRNASSIVLVKKSREGLYMFFGLADKFVYIFI